MGVLTVGDFLGVATPDSVPLGEVDARQVLSVAASADFGRLRGEIVAADFFVEPFVAERLQAVFERAVGGCAARGGTAGSRRRRDRRNGRCGCWALGRR